MAAAKTKPATAKRPAPLTPPAPRNGSTNGSGPRRVNLTERLASARAARAEAGHEAPVLEVDGQEYTLPIEMPYDFLHLCQRGQFAEAAAELGGQPLADAVKAQHLTVNDLETFFEAIAEDLYGVSEGK